MANNIKKRSDGRYENRFTVDGKRYSVYGNTMKECRDAETKKRMEIAAGITNHETVIVEGYCKQYFLSKRGRI